MAAICAVAARRGRARYRFAAPTLVAALLLAPLPATAQSPKLEARSAPSRPGTGTGTAAVHRADPAVHRHGGDQAIIVLDSSNAADACPCDPAPYAAQFAAMRPEPGTWLLTHRPVWGFGPHRRTLNASLQRALAAWNGRLPDGIALALAGHIHLAEVLSFADRRAPQFVLGTGGTLLAGKIRGNLTGRKIGGTRVSYGRADHRFGFASLERAADGWSATFRDAAGKSLFGCKVGPGQVGCN